MVGYYIHFMFDIFIKRKYFWIESLMVYSVIVQQKGIMNESVFSIGKIHWIHSLEGFIIKVSIDIRKKVFNLLIIYYSRQTLKFYLIVCTDIIVEFQIFKLWTSLVGIAKKCNGMNNFLLTLNCVKISKFGPKKIFAKSWGHN